MNHSNKIEQSMAESEEGRPLIKENIHQSSTRPTQSGTRVSPGLAGVRKAAREHKETKFTALLHHVTIDLLSFRENLFIAKLYIDGSINIDNIRRPMNDAFMSKDLIV